jgi:hypothetical protein
MEASYRKAKEFFEANGVVVCNATVGGKLEVFPRVSYDKLMNPKRAGCDNLLPAS